MQLSLDLPLCAVVSDEFTAEQASAIARREERLIVTANAGSGKTRVLTERFVRSVKTRVLPDPAFAVTIRRSERRAIAADCSAVNPSLTTAHIGRSRDSCIRPPSSRTSRGAARAGPL